MVCRVGNPFHVNVTQVADVPTSGKFEQFNNTDSFYFDVLCTYPKLSVMDV